MTERKRALEEAAQCCIRAADHAGNERGYPKDWLNMVAGEIRRLEFQAPERRKGERRVLHSAAWSPIRRKSDRRSALTREEKDAEQLEFEAFCSRHCSPGADSSKWYRQIWGVAWNRALALKGLERVPPSTESPAQDGDEPHRTSATQRTPAAGDPSPESAAAKELRDMATYWVDILSLNALEIIERAATLLESRGGSEYAALKACQWLVRSLPENWGDGVIDGNVTLTFDVSVIDAIEDAARKEQS